MSTPSTWKIHAAISTLIATTIVSFAALTLDQGHIAAAPRGIIEVGALTLVETAPAAVTP